MFSDRGEEARVRDKQDRSARGEDGGLRKVVADVRLRIGRIVLADDDEIRAARKTGNGIVRSLLCFDPFTATTIFIRRVLSVRV